MPKKCKSTIAAVLNRINAVERHRRIYHCQQGTIIDISCFGIDYKKTLKKGELTIEDIINELNNQ